MSLNVGVLVFPGANCDHDAYYALKHELGVDTNFIWHKETDLGNVDAIIIPGGFSYGDYLRSGAIARFSPVMKEVESFAEKGGPVLGICNGFQILLEAGMLPGTMMHNAHLRFTCKMTRITCRNNTTMFTSDVPADRPLEIPVAHGEGNYYADDLTLRELKEQNRIVFQYCNEKGEAIPEVNPNGSMDNIAGICNKKGNVLGMMPHPERAVDKNLGSDDGKFIFDSLIHQLSTV